MMGEDDEAAAAHDATTTPEPFFKTVFHFRTHPLFKPVFFSNLRAVVLTGGSL